MLLNSGFISFKLFAKTPVFADLINVDLRDVKALRASENWVVSRITRSCNFTVIDCPALVAFATVEFPVGTTVVESTARKDCRCNLSET